MDKKQVTLSPIDGSIYIEREYMQENALQALLERSAEAQQFWAEVSLSKRIEVCRNMLVEIKKNKDELAREITWMMGRPIRYAANEIAGMIERAEYMINQAPAALQTIEIGPKVGFQRYIKRDPVGIVLVIAPWNYPYLTAINSIIPALLAGNSVILKHSAQTPTCGEQLKKAFDAAGLSEGVFEVLHISHTATEKLIQHPLINFVAFTGSVKGGEMVERCAAGRFIGVGLELGGKDPAYVRQDADLDLAVEACVDGAFFNSGQSCCGIERIYVHHSLYDAFLEKAVTLIKQYELGRPDDPKTTLGPMVRTSSADFVRGQILDAVEKGAIPLIDEAEFPQSQEGTPYLAPQILRDVDHTMSIMTEESFGPVVGVMCVESDEEAIKLMNDSEFGLTASVFSQNIKAASEIGEKLETGTFFVNRCDYLDPALAWTGLKNSGRGCTLSLLGFDAFTQVKSFHIKTNEGNANE